MTLTFTDNLQLQSDLRSSLTYLSTHLVSIGIPPTSNSHSGPFTASELLALQERGSPINHIPPRPVLQPALSSPETRLELTATLMQAAASARKADLPATQSALEKTGEAGTRAIRRYILSGKLSANAPITVHGGWMRNRVSHKPVHIPGKGFNQPLVETGELLNSFGYKIKEK